MTRLRMCVGLAGLCMLALAPLTAGAALVMDGPTTWQRGQPIAVVLKADADTLVNSLFLDIRFEDYEALGSALELTNLPIQTVPAFLSSPDTCRRDAFGDICSFASAAGVNVATDTVLIKWEYTVKANAPLGPITFAPDFLIEAQVDGVVTLDPQIPWLAGKEFLIIDAPVDPIPEPGTMALTLAGLAVVGAAASRRRKPPMLG